MTRTMCFGLPGLSVARFAFSKRFLPLVFFGSLVVGILTTPRAFSAEVNLSGENWNLILPLAGRAVEANLRAFLEGAEPTYTAFFSSLNLESKESRALKIRIFPSREEYKTYQAAHSKSQS